ncbi:uncharacterized protein FIBRA_05255 [Fibroporia radiculosa]|uniref:Pentacotripeptide-repeat region of PRORP domain-containing protein n=1 Tax=Fibroporia radiculosa TaxID=599839 RepID=J4H3E5_9APHY|nr:uncharacterized protein FIBRA_05255 [Fibroporia radiculosa]CCM03134.1 predicted protein [Fibroporia radiculosa]
MRSAISQALTLDIYKATFDILAGSGSKEDIELMKKIFDITSSHFDEEEMSSMYDRAARRLLARHAVRAAFEWLSSENIHIAPRPEHWDTLVNQCVRQRNLLLTMAAISAMPKRGCQPTSLTFINLFQSLFQIGFFPQIRILRRFITLMKRVDVPRDPQIVQVLNDGYSKNGYPKLAKRAVEAYSAEYNTHSPSNVSPEDTLDANGIALTDAEVNARLGAVARERSKWAAARLYYQYRADGFKPTQETLLAVLSDASHTSVLQDWERIFVLSAGPAVWAKLIYNAVCNRILSAAIDVYNSAIAAGVRPTNAMLHPVLRLMCAGSLRPPTDATIDRAMCMYHDFVRHWEVDTEEVQGQVSPTTSMTPDAPIYNTLLRVLLSSSNTTKYFPTAVALLEDMRSRNVSMDSMTSTSLVIMLMRCSTSFEEAYKVYKLVCHQNHKSVLDQEGYTAVLNAFCKVHSSTIMTPPARLYFQIVQDMRQAGYKTTPQVYTIILRCLGSLSTRSSLSNDDNDNQTHTMTLVKMIKKIHQHLVVDASVNPDVVLWNQLMDTYQRAGCFAEALQIWETSYRSGQIDNASVSIILDTCGHANAYGTAMRVWSDLTESKFRLNLANWNAWLECLCRLGRVDDALRAMCLEMRQGTPPLNPTLESAHIILSFAPRTNQETEVRERIKRYLPKLWKILPTEHMQSD